jgi:hypothetical protein
MRLAVDQTQRFDGSAITHARDPERLMPATAAETVAARQRFGVPLAAKVMLIFGTAKRHRGCCPWPTQRTAA